MSARTLGWAQRKTRNTAGGDEQCVLNAILGTAIAADPGGFPGASATDQAFEVTAGTSVSIRWGGRLLGSTWSMAASNQCIWTLNVYYETGTTLWETAATSTGTQGGAATGDWHSDATLTFTPTHTGTVRMVVQARVEVASTHSVVALVNSDGGNFGSSAETLPATQTSVNFTPGLVRAGCALSSLAVTGGSTPVSYPDALTATFTTAAAPNAADGAYTLSWRDATPTQFDSDTIAAGTSTTLTVNRTVDNTWPKASTAVDLLLTPANSALSTALSGTGLPWIHFTSLPSSPGTVTGTASSGNAANKVTARFAGAFTADPRITFTHLLQVDDNTFGTPPSSKNVASNQRLTTQLGFTDARVTNAAGTGLNSITWSVSLQDHLGLTTALTATPTSATEGGQAGWGSTFLTWSSQLPGGQWDKTCTITAPAGAVGLESGNTATYTLLAKNPNYNPVIQAEQDAQPLDHFYPGMQLDLRYGLSDTSTHKSVTLDAGPSVVVRRWNASANYFEYLALDNTWVAWTAGVAADHRNMTVSAGDANTYTITFSAAITAAWTGQNLVIGVTSLVNGTPYPAEFPLEVVGSTNLHSKYVFDGAGFCGFPSK